MKKYNYLFYLGILGLFLICYGLFRAVVLGVSPWYAYFVVGGTLFFGWVNYLLKNKSLFYGFEQDKVFVLKSFLYYFIFGIMIEFFGRYLFGLWEYPLFSFYDETIYVFILGYPFPFFLIYETFVLIKGLVKSFGFSFLLATLISSFLHEIPNIYAREWVYNIPYVALEILGINIVVIFGWTILVLVPIVVNTSKNLRNFWRVKNPSGFFHKILMNK